MKHTKEKINLDEVSADEVTLDQMARCPSVSEAFDLE
jgi:hypothetical protein